MPRRREHFRSHEDARCLEQAWLWFFTGLSAGFQTETWEEVVKFPVEPRSDTPKLLSEERRRFPTVAGIQTKTAGGWLPQRKLWNELLSATTVQEIKTACRRSHFWPRDHGAVRDLRIFYYLSVLSDLAPMFLVAKTERRFPRSDRPTSDCKKILYLARAMAGAYLGVTPRFANEKLLKKRASE